MCRTRTVLIAFVAAVLLAAPAFAQGAAASPASEREAAIRQVPTYDESAPTVIGAEEETTQDAFLALAEDYIFLSEIGGRGPGRVPIWPRGAMKLGPFQIFPYLEGRIGWTNNVFDSETRNRSWFVTEGGGVAGKWDLAEGRAGISFGIDYRHWDYFGDNDESFSEVTAGLGAKYRFGLGMWLEAGFKWEHLVDPVDIQYSGRLERDQFYPYVTFGFDQGGLFGNKLKVEVGVQYLNAQFADTQYDTGDRQDWDAHLKVSYPFLQDKTHVYVRYDYLWSNRDSERINDLNGGHQVTGGLEGTIPLTRSERLTGILGLGYRQDVYASPRLNRIGSATIPTDDDSRKGTVTAMAALRYLAGPNTSFDLRGLRDLQFSASSNYQVVNRIDLAMTHNCLRNLVGRLGGFFEFTDPSEGGTFTRFGAGIGARYLLLDNFDLDFSADWSRRNTSRAGFDTEAFTASLGATLYFN